VWVIQTKGESVIVDDWRKVGGVPAEGELLRIVMRGDKGQESVAYCEVVAANTEGRQKGLSVRLGGEQYTYVLLKNIDSAQRYIELTPGLTGV
jgi:hypothetical protein